MDQEQETLRRRAMSGLNKEKAIVRLVSFLKIMFGLGRMQCITVSLNSCILFLRN